MRKCVYSGRLEPCRAEFCSNKNLAYAEKIDTSCMKIYRLITLEKITGIYSWTRTKYIVLTGNCFGSAAEQNFGGNEKLVYTKKQQTRNMFCMEIKAML